MQSTTVPRRYRAAYGAVQAATPSPAPAIAPASRSRPGLWCRVVVATNSAPSADLLALHIAHDRIHAGGEVQRVAADLGRVDDPATGHREGQHDGKHRPALA
jgi:hypothetical protein